MNIVFFFFLNVLSELFLFVELRETTLTISDSTGAPVSIESEIMRVVSLSTTEITEITRLKTSYSGSEYFKQVDRKCW